MPHSILTPTSAPVFWEFLDLVWQCTQQFPDCFEFNDLFLEEMLEETISGKWGEFVTNNRKEQMDLDVERKTSSFWGYIQANVGNYRNPHFKANNAVLYPATSFKSVRFWYSSYAKVSSREKPRRVTRA